MNRQKKKRLNRIKSPKAVLLPGSKGLKVQTKDGRVFTVKINNELSPRGKAVKVQLEDERQEILKRAQSMDEKFDKLLQLVSSK
jgi:hypothetical protein